MNKAGLMKNSTVTMPALGTSVCTCGGADSADVNGETCKIAISRSDPDCRGRGRGRMKHHGRAGTEHM